MSLYHSRYIYGDLLIISVYASYFTKVLVFNVWLQKEKQDGKEIQYKLLNSLEVTSAERFAAMVGDETTMDACFFELL